MNRKAYRGRSADNFELGTELAFCLDLKFHRLDVSSVQLTGAEFFRRLRQDGEVKLVDGAYDSGFID